jgi:hypothetical protein
MATLPSESQLQTVWSNLVAKFEAVRTFALTNSPNYVTLDNSLSDSLYPDHATAMTAAMAAARSRLNAMLGTPAAVSEFGPLLTTYARVLGVPEVNAQGIIDEIVRHFAANGYTVKSRGITFGSVSAGGSNVGTGTVHRLTVDEYGGNIEAVYAEAKTVRCIRDEHSGAQKHEEVFELRGTALLKDDLENTNSGFVGQARAMSGLSTSAYLSNPSFDSISGGTDAAPTGITGWDADTIADFQVTRNAGEYYRDYVGATSPGALMFEANNGIEQELSTRAVTWDPKVPLYCQCAVQRVASCDGTLTLSLGGVSKAVTMSTLTNGAWNILRLDLDADAWYKNWNGETLKLRIALASRTTGTCNVDDVIFQPMTRFGSQVNGTWVAVVGSPTPFLRDDVFTFSDTDGGTGKIQRWVFRAFGRYLPATSATPTWADPS